MNHLPAIMKKKNPFVFPMSSVCESKDNLQLCGGLAKKTLVDLEQSQICIIYFFLIFSVLKTFADVISIRVVNSDFSL